MAFRSVRRKASGKGTSLVKTDLLMPPAGRAEVIITGPAATVKNAQLLTREVNTGPGGDPDPARPIFNVIASTGESSAPKPQGHPGSKRGAACAAVRRPCGSQA